MKLRGHYEKPSEKRVREKAEAIRRARKLARKKLQREGLLPMKPRVIPAVTGRSGPVRPPPFNLEAANGPPSLLHYRCTMVGQLVAVILLPSAELPASKRGCLL